VNDQTPSWVRSEPGKATLEGVNWGGLSTLYIKEVRRFFKVQMQTVWAPAVTTLLYLIIFTVALGRAGREVMGVPFADFIAPGLIVMAMLQNSTRRKMSPSLPAIPTAAGREFVIRSVYENIVDGDSIACDGVCLTVREAGAGTFTVAAVVTTLERTTLGSWTAGHRVNTERAMALGERAQRGLVGERRLARDPVGIAAVRDGAKRRREGMRVVDAAVHPHSPGRVVDAGGVAGQGHHPPLQAEGETRQDEAG